MKIVFPGGGALRLLDVVDEILKRPDTFAEPHIVLRDVDLDAARTVSDKTCYRLKNLKSRERLRYFDDH